MWRLPDDQSEPVITAKQQINSAHRQCALKLPKTAMIFFMSKGVEYLCDQYNARLLEEPFPRFLNRCPIWAIDEYQLCFLDGGRGAPQACDTVETLAALGVQNIIAVGMFGAFDEKVNIGEIIVPEKAFVEEGTSLHYYAQIDTAAPDLNLLKSVSERFHFKTYPIVSTDAVYRQTFAKEALWRSKGAVGVDMETSAVFSVSHYLGLNAVAILMASDIHPKAPDEKKWQWHMTKEMKYDLAEKGMTIARELQNNSSNK